ncbi:MAG: PA14 domain-containing protein, partial [Patescibacteria group bacterium]
MMKTTSVALVLMLTMSASYAQAAGARTETLGIESHPDYSAVASVEFAWGTSPGSHPNVFNAGKPTLGSYNIPITVPDSANLYAVARAIGTNGLPSIDSNEIVRLAQTTPPPTPGDCASGEIAAEYYANATLSGTPVVTGCETVPLAHAWGNGGPAGLPIDNFSARWTGTFAFVAGTHRFTVTADDGVRVRVDGQVL